MQWFKKTFVLPNFKWTGIGWLTYLRYGSNNWYA